MHKHKYDIYLNFLRPNTHIAHRVTFTGDKFQLILLDHKDTYKEEVAKLLFELSHAQNSTDIYNIKKSTCPCILFFAALTRPKEAGEKLSIKYYIEDIVTVSSNRAKTIISDLLELSQLKNPYSNLFEFYKILFNITDYVNWRQEKEILKHHGMLRKYTLHVTRKNRKKEIKDDRKYPSFIYNKISILFNESLKELSEGLDYWNNSKNSIYNMYALDRIETCINDTKIGVERIKRAHTSKYSNNIYYTPKWYKLYKEKKTIFLTNDGKLFALNIAREKFKDGFHYIYADVLLLYKKRCLTVKRVCLKQKEGYAIWDYKLSVAGLKDEGE